MSKRVAITVESKDGLEANIDPRFGRAQHFLIIDLPQRKIVDQVENDAKDLAHGAGTGSAAVMSNNKVEVVISGRFGPKAEQALEKMGIEMQMAPSGKTAGEALDMLEGGSLDSGSAGGGRGMGGGGRGRGVAGGGRGMGGGARGRGIGGGGRGMGRGGRGMGGGGGAGKGGCGQGAAGDKSTS